MTRPTFQERALAKAIKPGSVTVIAPLPHEPVLDALLRTSQDPYAWVRNLLLDSIPMRYAIDTDRYDA